MPYLTPEISPSTSQCRRLLLPNDMRVRAAILGQLLELTEAWNWEQTDGISVADTVALFQTVYDDYLQEAVCMIGAIVAILNDAIPSNMLLCDGSTFDEADYPELYAILPAFLQLDPNTGKVPDLQGRFIIATDGVYLAHNTGGVTEVSLSEAELPPHAHWYDKETFNIDIESVGVPDPTGVGLPHIPTLTSSVGSGDAHDNMPPYYSLRYCVVAK